MATIALKLYFKKFEDHQKVLRILFTVIFLLLLHKHRENTYLFWASFEFCSADFLLPDYNYTLDRFWKLLIFLWSFSTLFLLWSLLFILFGLFGIRYKEIFEKTLVFSALRINTIKKNGCLRSVVFLGGVLT